MSILSEYKPYDVLKYFEEISAIPHGSYNIDRISDYLVSFAKKRNFKYRQDEKKNVVIFKAAQGNVVSDRPVIIQGHMDMVAVKTALTNKNMDEEGLDLEVIDGDYISAKETSLGGDDGIAVAYALALLDSDTIPHPPLEVVITVNEEVGMLGADYLDTSDLKGKMLLNIDSEDEGVFTVSCAGGAANICNIPGNKVTVNDTQVTIKIDGLLGGHSGVDINQGRLNAIVALSRILNSLNNYNLVSINGGEKDNAIARFATAVINTDNPDYVIESVGNISELIKSEYETVEPDINIRAETTTSATIEAFDNESTDRIVSALVSFPNGVIRMNPDIKDMVQTSVNIGVIKTSSKDVEITTLLRSSNNSEKEYLSAQIKAVIKLVKGTVKEEGVYPGWAYNPDSKLRDIMIDVYKKQYGKDPVVEGIHAGLECGLFASKIEGLDCISFGPQIDDIHTTNERLSISSVERTWELIKGTLELLCKEG